MSRIITAPRLPLRETAAAVAPGLCLAILIALAAHSLEEIERALTGTAWIEALVIAIVLGAGARSAGLVSARAHRGIDVAARPVLEVAIVLLGASLDVHAMLASGPVLDRKSTRLNSSH